MAELQIKTGQLKAIRSTQKQATIS